MKYLENEKITRQISIINCTDVFNDITNTYNNQENSIQKNNNNISKPIKSSYINCCNDRHNSTCLYSANELTQGTISTKSTGKLFNKANSIACSNNITAQLNLSCLELTSNSIYKPTTTPKPCNLSRENSRK